MADVTIKVNSDIVAGIGKQFKAEDESRKGWTNGKAAKEWLKQQIKSYRSKSVQQGVDTSAQEAAGDAINAAKRIEASERVLVDNARKSAVANMEASIDAGVS